MTQAFLRAMAAGLRLACGAGARAGPAVTLSVGTVQKRAVQRHIASCCWAMRRSHCIRWRDRGSTSACAMRRNWPNCWLQKAGGCREPPRCWRRYAAMRARGSRRRHRLHGHAGPRVFQRASAPGRRARDAGLLLFDLLPPAKRALSRVSLGFGAALATTGARRWPVVDRDP